MQSRVGLQVQVRRKRESARPHLSRYLPWREKARAAGAARRDPGMIFLDELDPPDPVSDAARKRISANNSCPHPLEIRRRVQFTSLDLRFSREVLFTKIPAGGVLAGWRHPFQDNGIPSPQQAGLARLRPLRPLFAGRGRAPILRGPGKGGLEAGFLFSSSPSLPHPFQDPGVTSPLWPLSGPLHKTHRALTEDIAA